MEVQHELVAILTTANASSLDVERKIAQKQKHTNLVSLALRRRPDLVAVQRRAGARPVLKVRQPAMSQYIESHRRELEEEAEGIRREAQAAQAMESRTAIPMSNHSWMVWLEQHTADFQRHLKESTATRRALNVRRCLDARAATFFSFNLIDIVVREESR